ncbi:MAG: DUF4118 domain-containing protein [Magnetococcales bacterium]|nr:DUF4118 domain-containing protein [Magnetococcales bacterium]
MMSDAHIDTAQPSPGKGCLLACVGPGPATIPLLHAAHQLAEELGVSWLAVTVDTLKTDPTHTAERQQQLAHLRLAESLGARTLQLSGKHVGHEIIRCALQQGVHRILIGKPTQNRWRDRFRPSLVHELVRCSGHIEVQFIAEQGVPQPALALLSNEMSTSWRGYIASLFSVIITTVLVSLGRHYLTPPDLVMLYLLPIMAVAFRFGQGPALAASAFSVAAYDFFFVHPYLTFLVSDSQYILTFTLLFMVGIVISSLMARIRRQEQAAQERELQTEAEIRAAAVRAKAEELRGVMRMVSHDLRTPLGAITGAGTTLRDDEGTLNAAQQQEMLETICTEAVRMDRLITNLLDMARLESAGCQLCREWIPFEELVGSAMAGLEERLQGRPITVQVDTRVPMLYVDPVFFTQVLINLLDNASKYTPVGTALSWTVTSQADRVAIRIQDRGPGIPPGQEERIFEKFVRGTSVGVPGSGLGLAICRGVIEMHGGTIQAVPNTAGGGEFLILLPHPPLPPEMDTLHNEREEEASAEERPQ